MTKAIELEDVCLRVGGRQIFSDLNLSADPGEILSICGTSSAHQDYFIPLFTRVYPSSYSVSGKVLLNGVETERLYENEMRYMRMMDIGILPSPSVAKKLRYTVKKYIVAPFSEDLKKSPQQILTDAKRILQLFGISNPVRLLSKRMHTLSIKELRFVLYAAALATDPSIAILSVPEEDIHDAHAEELYALIIKICKIKNTTLLLLTDNIEFARKYGEQVYFMKNDRLLKADGAFHPYLGYLEQAARMSPFPKHESNGKEHLYAEDLVLRRGMEKTSFSLRAGDVFGVPTIKAMPIYTGKRRPHSGKLLYAGKNVHKSKLYPKKRLIIKSNMLFPPQKNVEGILRAMSPTPLGKEELTRLMAIIGLSYDFCTEKVENLSLYDTFRLGMLVASILRVNVILLEKPEKMDSMVNQYDIVKMLYDVCTEIGAVGLVFTENRKLLHAINRETE